MPLVTSTEMFKKAYDGGYAIGAFNVNNMEIVQGITEACQEEHAPVILQVSKGARAYANHTYLVKLVEAAVECCPDIPIVLHLDHGPDFETCKSCIDGGFTSVMIDGSSKSFEDNIALTRQVVEYAPAGTIFHKNEYSHPYTEGLMLSIPRLDTPSDERLEAIPGAVPHPLDLPKGCKFAPRCKYATERCLEEEPELIHVSDTQQVRCFYAKKEDRYAK